MTMKYPDSIADEICTRIAEGQTLRSICRDAHMPAFQRVYEWLGEDEEFSGRFARARELGFDAIAQEALAIADTPQTGEEIEESDDGKVKTKRSDMLGHRKLQVETRLKLLAKWCPSKYGDRTAMELTGANGGPVQLSDSDRAAKLAGLLALAEQRKGDGNDEGE